MDSLKHRPPCGNGLLQFDIQHRVGRCEHDCIKSSPCPVYNLIKPCELCPSHCCRVQTLACCPPSICWTAFSLTYRAFIAVAFKPLVCVWVWVCVLLRGHFTKCCCRQGSLAHLARSFPSFFPSLSSPPFIFLILYLSLCPSPAAGTSPESRKRIGRHTEACT